MFMPSRYHQIMVLGRSGEEFFLHCFGGKAAIFATLFAEILFDRFPRRSKEKENEKLFLAVGAEGIYHFGLMFWAR
ncbi:hypothetical protein CEXT_431221 [Caerostris extrusa]|uniref:Uncharacterized protein n=1 Tax=Caerostris extrusa TaxID=172846 RepID=A0AAV4UI07_CAEEX|nr:hypothetical protein CEXT_431221 [Caerostris extrusa]